MAFKKNAEVVYVYINVCEIPLIHGVLFRYELGLLRKFKLLKQNENGTVTYIIGRYSRPKEKRASYQKTINNTNLNCYKIINLVVKMYKEMNHITDDVKKKKKIRKLPMYINVCEISLIHGVFFLSQITVYCVNLNY